MFPICGNTSCSSLSIITKGHRPLALGFANFAPLRERKKSWSPLKECLRESEKSAYLKNYLRTEIFRFQFIHPDATVWICRKLQFRESSNPMLTEDMFLCNVIWSPIFILSPGSSTIGLWQFPLFCFIYQSCHQQRWSNQSGISCLLQKFKRNV